MPKLSHYVIIAGRRQSCKNTGSHNLQPRATFRKALSLIRLSRLGLAVPAGFCITAAAFQEHLEQNKLLARLKTAPAPLETDAEVLKGLAVSAGVVTGNARVILRTAGRNTRGAFYRSWLDALYCAGRRNRHG